MLTPETEYMYSMSASRSASTWPSTAGSMQDKETNIQVVLRMRPRNAQERRDNSVSICSLTGGQGTAAGETSSLAKGIDIKVDKHLTKTYTFDKVFGPTADQACVYDHVVVPFMQEVLQGYNCTLFA